MNSLLSWFFGFASTRYLACRFYLRSYQQPHGRPSFAIGPKNLFPTEVSALPFTDRLDDSRIGGPPLDPASWHKRVLPRTFPRERHTQVTSSNPRNPPQLVPPESISFSSSFSSSSRRKLSTLISAAENFRWATLAV